MKPQNNAADSERPPTRSEAPPSLESHERQGRDSVRFQWVAVGDSRRSSTAYLGPRVVGVAAGGDAAMQERDGQTDDELTRHLRGIRARLRTLASEADRMAGRIEALATLLDRHVTCATAARRDRGQASRATRRSRREPPAVSVLHWDVRDNGAVVVRADALPSIVLVGAPAELFCFLAKPEGRDAGDGLVGYKAHSDILHHLAAWQNKYVTRRALVQLVYRLRQSLGQAVANGDGLVEYRRGRGYRVRVRLPQP